MENKSKNFKSGFTQTLTFKKRKKLVSGFTIIEMMIAISIFLIVILIGVGALMNANRVSNESKNIRSIMDNLNFIMEDMSRNIRTGYSYQCAEKGTNFSLSGPQSCQNGWGLALENVLGDPASNSDQWVYYIQSGKIYKSIEGMNNPIQLNADEIVIDYNKSGFSVLGAGTFPGDIQQPLVLIRLSGKIIYLGKETTFFVQTSVSQRIDDI